jgi:hypothetical protein
LNARLVDYFRSQAPYLRPVTPKSEAGDPYYEAGAHPEVVEDVWDKLAAKLPDESRCLLYGVPVIVQPDSGIVLAVAMGTGYFVRVPEEDMAAARSDGYLTTWSLTPPFDATEVFGGDWVLGQSRLRESRWRRFMPGRPRSSEARWCRTLYERFKTPADDRAMLTPDTPAKARHKHGTLVLTVSEGPHLTPHEIATNPDGNAIDQCIRSRSWQGMTFVILERENNSMTASGSLDDGMSLTCIVDNVERVSAKAPESIDTIVAVMQSFARGDGNWGTMIDWD